MQRLEVSGAVRPIYGSLGVKRLIYLITVYFNVLVINKNFIIRYFNSYCKRNGIPLSAHLIVP